MRRQAGTKQDAEFGCARLGWDCSKIDMGRDLADRFVGMYVNHWTLDYGEKGRESIRRFLRRAHEKNLIPRAPELEFVV